MVNRVGRFLLALSASVVVAVPAAAQTAADRPVTFTKDIAPILQRSCQRCHRPDSVAPMSLLTYEQVRPYARAMKQRTALRARSTARRDAAVVPREEHRHPEDSRTTSRCSDEEIAMIARGPTAARRGATPPTCRRRASSRTTREWTLGKPDLIVSSPTVSSKAIASRLVGRASAAAPTGLTEDRYVASAEYKEDQRLREQEAGGARTVGGLFVFHHATAVHRS